MPINVAEILEATTGGTRRHLVDLVTHLDPAVFKVTVICAAERDPRFLSDIERMRTLGVCVEVVPMVRRISPLRDAAAFLHIRRILRAGRFDVVHTHSAKAGILGRLAAWPSGSTRVIHTPHVFPFQMDVGKAKRLLYRVLERIATRVTDVIVCVSTEEEQVARQAGLTSHAVTRVIPNGILSRPAVAAEAARAAAAACGVPAQSVVVGSVGRLTRQKGYRFLLDAAPRILRDHPQACFLLVGDGALREALEAQVRRLGVADRVCFAGAREDIEPLLACMDIFVLPSLWEGLPYALLEAMEMGKAVVATAVGGVKDVLQSPGTGRLVAPGDADALAEAIAGLLSDPPQRAAMGSAARLAVGACYHLDAMVSAVEAVYKDA